MGYMQYEESDGISREEWLEYRRKIKREEREEEVYLLKKMILQKIIGIVFLLMTVLILVIASHAQVKGDLDATPVFLTFPLGVYLLLTKECFII